jgi:hypothetical protein
MEVPEQLRVFLWPHCSSFLPLPLILERFSPFVPRCHVPFPESFLGMPPILPFIEEVAR